MARTQFEQRSASHQPCRQALDRPNGAPPRRLPAPGSGARADGARPVFGAPPERAGGRRPRYDVPAPRRLNGARHAGGAGKGEGFARQAKRRAASVPNGERREQAPGARKLPASTRKPGSGAANCRKESRPGRAGLDSSNGRTGSGQTGGLALGAWRLALGAWRLALGAWRLALGAWRLALGAWRLALGAWRLALGAWRLGAWRLALGAWRLALNSRARMDNAQLPRLWTTRPAR